MWKNFAEKVTEPTLTTVDVKRLSPSAAREIDTFVLKIKDENPEQLSGKYVVIWERVRGEWKISTDIWN
jgi:ketosteroid isomerase-like protein